MIYVFLTLLTFSVTGTCHAQDTNDIPLDSVMTAEIRKAWKESSAFNRNEADDPGAVNPIIAYAPVFFEYYLEHPAEPTGDLAGKTAFMFWGLADDSLAVLDALPKIENSATLWHRIIPPLSNAFYDSAGKYKSEYRELLHKLRKRITEKEGIASVLLELSSIDKKKAQQYYQEVIDLNASPLSVQRAKSSLYELEYLVEGKKAPHFKATSISGEIVDLETMRGTVVLLEFWATSCGPCMPDIPKIKSLYEKHDSQQLTVIGIATDDKEQKLLSFLEDQQMQWTQIMQSTRMEEDGSRYRDDILEKYNVNGLPRSMVIDQEGVIVAKNLRGDALVAAIENELTR